MVELTSEQKFNSLPFAELEEGVAWNRIGEEALHLLREYIRFPTVNDPESLDSDQMAHSPWLAGREAEAVQWLAGFLQSEGIATEVLEAAPGRLNLIARLSGTGHGRAVTLLRASLIDLLLCRRCLICSSRRTKRTRQTSTGLSFITRSKVRTTKKPCY